MKKKVALVLSSGGARGISHIGVIQVLEQRGYEISSISGTSMGALIGGFYAAGQLQDYTDWLVTLDRMDVFRLVDFSISSNGLVKGKKIIERMKQIIPDRMIEELEIPFSAITTDILLGEEKVITSGPLYDAIRASISIPTVFQPYMKGKDYFVDGGLLNPIPVNRVLRTDGDLLVVSDVNGLPTNELFRLDKEEKMDKKHRTYFEIIQDKLAKIVPTKETDQMGIFNLTNKSIGLMLHKISQLTLEKNEWDILIQFPSDMYGTFEFHKARELIDIGIEKAEKALDRYETGQNAIRN